MKLIIAGSRHLHISIEQLKDMLFLYKLTPSQIVCGMAKGIDSCGYLFGQYYLNVPIKEFHADWNTYGSSAGPLRNYAMAKYSDALLLIWDGKSNGSKNMKKCMEKLKKPIYEVII